MKPHIVAFVDVLGFSDRLRDVANNQDAAAKLLESFKSSIDESITEVNKFDAMLIFRGFSDNILLAVDLEGAHHEDTLGVAVMAVAGFQLSMALNGWFVRGGIAIGDFYVDNRIVFGTALLDAVDIEKNTARGPRVLMTKPIRDSFRRFTTFYEVPVESPENHQVLVDSNGEAFVNYLAFAYDDSYPAKSRSRIKMHKSRIEDAIAANHANDTVLDKYFWLASYHDFFCRTWLPNEDNLIIQPKRPIASFSRLVEPSI